VRARSVLCVSVRACVRVYQMCCVVIYSVTACVRVYVCMYYCRPPTAKTQCPNLARVCRNICMCVRSVAKGKNTEVCESERATIPTLPTLPTLPPWARTDTAMVSRWKARVRVPSNKHRVHMCMSSPRASPKCLEAMIVITILARSSSKPFSNPTCSQQQ